MGQTPMERNEADVTTATAPTPAALTAGDRCDRCGAQAYLRVGDARVTEGNAGTVDAAFTVSLLAPSTRTVKVNAFTSDSSASAAGNDYTQTSVTLTFPSTVMYGM